MNSSAFRDKERVNLPSSENILRVPFRESICLGELVHSDVSNRSKDEDRNTDDDTRSANFQATPIADLGDRCVSKPSVALRPKELDLVRSNP